ncbi:MAG: sodium:solute symporter, partial [Candidatus Neomarinimicrobiota bacterium]
AVIYKALAPEGTTEYAMFIVSTTASLLGSVLGTLLTGPTDDATLFRFYKVTRPFGFWRRFKAQLRVDNQGAVDAENRRDILSVIMAVPWQIVFFLFMMSLVFKTWGNVAALGSLFVALSAGLYFTWYRHLSTEVKVEE